MKKYWLFLLIVFFSNQLLGQKSTIEKSGDIIQIALPVAAFASTQIWKDEQKAGWQFVKTMGVSIILTHSLKRIIDKTRPNGGSYSFPSGHTSSAFTGAAFIQKRYGWKIGVPAYLLAGFVGWSRVYANKHDYWDVLGGAAIGIGSAYLFTRPYNKNKADISFCKSGTYYLFSLNYKF